VLQRGTTRPRRIFESRLKRARAGNRLQYIRVQATHLNSNRGCQGIAREFLERVIRDYPDDFQAKFAWEQLGASYAFEGRPDDADRAFREALRLCDESPIGNSGTSNTIELQLAEVLTHSQGSGAVSATGRSTIGATTKRRTVQKEPGRIRRARVTRFFYFVFLLFRRL
jgi:Flp pilus assembly protein TadD